MRHFGVVERNAASAANDIFYVVLPDGRDLQIQTRDLIGREPHLARRRVITRFGAIFIVGVVRASEGRGQGSGKQ